MPYEIRAMQAVRQRIKQAATPIHIPPGPGRLTSKTKIRYKFSRSGKKGVLWCWPVPDAGDCSRPACDYQIKKCLQICSGQFPSKISLGGIPDSCNVLFLQIFLKRAAKPSARNTSAGFPWVKWPQILLNVPWLCTKASQTFSDFFSGTLLNLLRNPDERDLALHQSLPDLRQNLLRNPVEPDLVLHQSRPKPPKPSPNLRNLLRNPVESDPAPAPVHTGTILGWKFVGEKNRGIGRCLAGTHFTIFWCYRLAYYAGKLCFWTALDRKKWLRVRFLPSLKMRWKNVLLYKQPIYDEMVATLAGNMTLSKYRKFSQEQIWKKNDEKYPYLWNDWIKKTKKRPAHSLRTCPWFVSKIVLLACQ